MALEPSLVSGVAFELQQEQLVDHISDIRHGRLLLEGMSDSMMSVLYLRPQDINLDADPERPEGGRKEGFGSFFNYQQHCLEDAGHAKGRNDRLKKKVSLLMI